MYNVKVFTVTEPRPLLLLTVEGEFVFHCWLLTSKLSKIGYKQQLKLYHGHRSKNFKCARENPVWPRRHPSPGHLIVTDGDERSTLAAEVVTRSSYSDEADEFATDLSTGTAEREEMM